jgi:hypothetical protein
MEFPQGEVKFVTPDSHKHNYTGVYCTASLKSYVSSLLVAHIIGMAH